MIRGPCVEPAPQETNVFAVVEVMNNSETNQEALLEQFNNRIYDIPSSLLEGLDVIDVKEKVAPKKDNSVTIIN